MLKPEVPDGPLLGSNRRLSKVRRTMLSFIGIGVDETASQPLAPRASSSWTSEAAMKMYSH